MKKPLIYLVLGLFISIQSFGMNASSFDLSADFDQTEFVELNDLNAAVTATSDLSTLETSSYLGGHKFKSGMSALAFSISDMDWGSFAWGFCCCPIGFFVVAINKNKDDDQKLSYWIGVGVNAVLNAISTGVYYAAIL